MKANGLTIAILENRPRFQLEAREEVRADFSEQTWWTLGSYRFKFFDNKMVQ